MEGFHQKFVEGVGTNLVFSFIVLQQSDILVLVVNSSMICSKITTKRLTCKNEILLLVKVLEPVPKLVPLSSPHSLPMNIRCSILFRTEIVIDNGAQPKHRVLGDRFLEDLSKDL